MKDVFIEVGEKLFWWVLKKSHLQVIEYYNHLASYLIHFHDKTTLMFTVILEILFNGKPLIL